MNTRLETSHGIAVRHYIPQSSFAVSLSVRLQCCWTHDEACFVESGNGHFNMFESADYSTGEEFVRAVVARAQALGINDTFIDWRDRILV